VRIVAGFLAAIALPLAARAQPPRMQFRCEVPSFTGAMSPGGARTTMVVVSDGLACTFTLYGVQAERRNLATDGEVTEAPQHGTASMLGSGARYIADRGYTGRDAFAVRALARDADNVERTIVVRVDVDVRPTPFDRTVTGNVAVLMAAAPIRVGNDIPVPRKTKDARAVYPPDALAAGAQGVVVLDATIEPDGKVSTARVIRSVPFLDAAAISAVSQWEFTPTVVDGRAVAVIMTLNVSFKRPDGSSPPAATTAPMTPASAAPMTPASAAPMTPASPPSTPVTAPPAPAAPTPRATPTPVAVPRAAAPDADVEMAFDQLQRRQYEDAVKSFRSANERRAQKCAVCWLGMARAYEALGAAKNVVGACDRALAVGDAEKALVVQAHQLKAIALEDMAQTNDPKRLHEAEDELRAAMAIEPSANYLHFNLGVVLLRAGRDADGVAELRAELEMRPDGPYAPRARQMIENPRRARENYAPSFSVVTLDREFLDLNALKGKAVLLDFWGTWCPPCVTAVPTLRGLQKRHDKEPFVILSVSSDSDEAVVRAFIDKNQMVWPQYWDRDRKVQQAFDVRAYPTYVLIDDEGVIRFRTTGGGTTTPAGLDDAIRKQLKAMANRATNLKAPQ
jgi:TonB family protein